MSVRGLEVSLYHHWLFCRVSVILTNRFPVYAFGVLGQRDGGNAPGWPLVLIGSCFRMAIQAAKQLSVASFSVIALHMVEDSVLLTSSSSNESESFRSNSSNGPYLQFGACCTEACCTTMKARVCSPSHWVKVD